MAFVRRHHGGTCVVARGRSLHLRGSACFWLWSCIQAWLRSNNGFDGSDVHDLDVSDIKLVNFVCCRRRRDGVCVLPPMDL